MRAKNVSLILNRLPHTGIRYVVVVALATERIPAALHATGGTDRSTAVTALRYRKFAAQHTYVAVTGYVFDLAVYC
jgi:hypothetical protein